MMSEVNNISLQQGQGWGRKADLLLLHAAPQLSQTVWVEVQSIQLLWFYPILLSAPLAILSPCHPHLHHLQQHCQI